MLWLRVSRLYRSLTAAALFTFPLLAQMPAQWGSVDVKRVGHRIACQCGCPDTVATCNMLECSFSKPAKEKIFRMQQAGVSDQAIIDAFLKEYGAAIYRGAPNAFGWVIPYAALAAGLAVIVWFVRKYRRQPLTAAAPELSRYQEQIEKDLAHLE